MLRAVFGQVEDGRAAVSASLRSTTTGATARSAASASSTSAARSLQQSTSIENGEHALAAELMAVERRTVPRALARSLRRTRCDRADGLRAGVREGVARGSALPRLSTRVQRCPVTLC